MNPTPSFPPAAAPREATAPRPAPGAATAAEADTRADAGAAKTGRGADKPPQQGWLESLRSIFSELPGLVSDRIDLLTLELKRAGAALAQIVVLLVAAAILGVTLWLAFWVGMGVGLVQLGLHWTLSLLVVMGLNAVAAGFALGRVRKLLPRLSLPATRRHLTPATRPARAPGTPAASTSAAAPGVARASPTTAAPAAS